MEHMWRCSHGMWKAWFLSAPDRPHVGPMNLGFKASLIWLVWQSGHIQTWFVSQPLWKRFSSPYPIAGKCFCYFYSVHRKVSALHKPFVVLLFIFVAMLFNTCLPFNNQAWYCVLKSNTALFMGFTGSDDIDFNLHFKPVEHSIASKMST